MNDRGFVTYEGEIVRLQPRQLREGGWKADFTVIYCTSGFPYSIEYFGQNTYLTRSTAAFAALRSACEIIDEGASA